MPVSYSWALSPQYTGSIDVPTSYSWDLISESITGALPPNPGPPVPAIPTFKDSRKTQFERGIKFGNVPGGRADNVVHGGPRIYHVNCALNVAQRPSDVVNADVVNVSGVVKFRFTRRTRQSVPDSVKHTDGRGIDEFGNPVFSFTGHTSGSI